MNWTSGSTTYTPHPSKPKKNTTQSCPYSRNSSNVPKSKPNKLMKRWRDSKNSYRKKTTCFKKSRKKYKTLAKLLRKSSKLIVKALRILYRRWKWKKKCFLTKFKSLTLKRFNFSTKSEPFKPITSPYKQKLVNSLMSL